jgi:hypothetical protein
MCDVVWKLGDVNHARRSKKTQEEIGADSLFSVLSSRTPLRLDLDHLYDAVKKHHRPIDIGAG